MPTSGGEAIQWPLALHAKVPPELSRARLYLVFCVQASPSTAPRSMYGTHAGAVPSHVTGIADAVAADTIGAAMNPQPSATAAMSFMGHSVGACAHAGCALGSLRMKSLAAVLLVGLSSIVALAPPANADVVAYLVNVTVRPGYNFPNADAAIGYGNSICDRVAAKMSYAQLVEQVKADFNTADYYQGGYLINQAVNELCPAQIWQLRQSAAGYTLPA
jgi:hypothetical protein